MAHVFEVCTYQRPTYCDSCDKFLWGLVKQGHQCRYCQANVHKKCRSQFSDPCPAMLTELLDEDNYLRQSSEVSSDDTPSSVTPEPTTPVLIEDTDPVGDALLRRETASSVSQSHNQSKLTVANTTLTPSMSASMAIPKNTTSRKYTGKPSSANASQINTSDSGSIVHDLALNTALTAKEMKKQAKEGMPRLNFATTMPKNLTRFVMRVGPLVTIQDELVEIFTWKNPHRTVAIMLGYILVCLYPVLLLVLPQAAFIHYLIGNYFAKARKETGKPKLNVNLQYLKNLQFIQNHMGIYADTYDEVRSHRKLVNWSDETETLRLLKLSILSMVIVVPVVAFVPLRLICLVGGLSLFIQNTAIFVAAKETLQPVLMRNIQDRVDYVREAISNVTKAGANGKTTVVIFENQRWWAGLGWISHLLRSERPAWSDEGGQTAKPAKDLYELPGNEWEWTDNDWKVDMNWSSTMDENGWVFTDHHWCGELNKAGVTSLTRRRAWTKTMALKKLD